MPLLRRLHVLSRVSKRFRYAALHTMRAVTVRQPRPIDDRVAWKADQMTGLFPSLTDHTFVICRPLNLSVDLPTALRSLKLRDDSSGTTRSRSHQLTLCRLAPGGLGELLRQPGGAAHLFNTPLLLRWRCN